MNKALLFGAGFGAALAATLCSSQASSAEPIKGGAESTAITIQKALDKNGGSIGLQTNQLRDYTSFKAALSSLVISKYKPIVRTTSNGFVDAVLRPIYNNLILRRIDGDRLFAQQASLTAATARIGILANGEVLLYQQVSFTPKKVVSCAESNRSGNLLCVKTSKDFAKLEAEYKKNPDPALEKGIATFKQTYKENPALLARLRGWDLQGMSTLQAAYAGLAAMPQMRERGSKFLPAAVFAYAKPSDGGGSNSGSEGPVSPGATPGGNIRVPGGGNVSPGVRSAIPEDTHQSGAFSTAKLDATKPETLVASAGTTQALLNENSQVAWEVSGQGANTSYELLNGFTNNHRASIGDRWNIVCIDYNPWWPGCTNYWFGFELGYGYLYGIRAGFNVTTTAQITNAATRSGSMAVHMDTGNKGAPVYRGSGLRDQDVFGGKELLARLCQQNSCFVALLGDMPGPDPLSTRFTRWTLSEIDFLQKLPTCDQVRSELGARTECSALDLMRNGNYQWPDADARVNLARWVSPVDLFGAQLNYGVASIEANPYLALNTDGKGYRQAWNSYANRDNRTISSRTSDLTFNFSRPGDRRNPLVTGINNEYDFNFSITPGVALRGSVVGYGLGPWYIDIDALAIESPTFTLYRHQGTYNGAWTGVPLQ